MAKKQDPVSDVIQTEQLPAICPACGSPRISAGPNKGIWYLGCLVCEWTAKYAIIAPEKERG